MAMASPSNHHNGSAPSSRERVAPSPSSQKRTPNTPVRTVRTSKTPPKGTGLTHLPPVASTAGGGPSPSRGNSGNGALGGSANAAGALPPVSASPTTAGAATTAKTGHDEPVEESPMNTVTPRLGARERKPSVSDVDDYNDDQFESDSGRGESPPPAPHQRPQGPSSGTRGAGGAHGVSPAPPANAGTTAAGYRRKSGDGSPGLAAAGAASGPPPPLSGNSSGVASPPPATAATQPPGTLAAMLAGASGSGPMPPVAVAAATGDPSAQRVATVTSPGGSGRGPDSAGGEKRREIEINLGKKELIGTGTYGHVYRAVDVLTNRLVAVKEIVLEVEDAKDLKKQVHAIEREIRVMQKLDHPNIVKYLGAKRVESVLYIYMEFVPGGTIASFIKSFGPMQEAQAAQFTIQILDGLCYLHSRNIAHRDLKGENLFVDANGGLKLGDFGTSKELKTIKFTKTVAGTPYFMAPEVINCSGHGVEADVWSVGCCVLQMVVGRPPFFGCDNPFSVMMQVTKGAIEKEIPETISADCRDFIRSCCKMEPRDRLTCPQLLRHRWLAPFVGPRPGAPPAESVEELSAATAAAAVRSTPPPPAASAVVPTATAAASAAVATVAPTPNAAGRHHHHHPHDTPPPAPRKSPPPPEATGPLTVMPAEKKDPPGSGNHGRGTPPPATRQNGLVNTPSRLGAMRGDAPGTVASPLLKRKDSATSSDGSGVVVPREVRQGVRGLLKR